MKFLLLFLLSLSSLFATLNVQTTYTTVAQIVKKIGGDNVHVHTLASAHYDPHFIVPKPSLISKLRRADMLIINGGGLELGWLPPLLKGAHNGKIRPGAKGFVDVSNAIKLIDKPVAVSRAFGDVHAQGNPHYMLDPYNVLPIAKFISDKLSIVDPANADDYAQNLVNFEKEWSKYLQTLDTKMSTCRDKNVVQYHELFNYFLKRYDFKSLGNIEPLPGISPSSKHTIELLKVIKNNNIKKILHDVYHSQKTGKFIASKTDAKLLILPHDVNSVNEADTLENFYNFIANQLCQ